jgi:hypothetical protein
MQHATPTIAPKTSEQSEFRWQLARELIGPQRKRAEVHEGAHLSRQRTTNIVLLDHEEAQPGGTEQAYLGG